jgi:hypothetical protein
MCRTEKSEGRAVLLSFHVSPEALFPRHAEGTRPLKKPREFDVCYILVEPLQILPYKFFLTGVIISVSEFL